MKTIVRINGTTLKNIKMTNKKKHMTNNNINRLTKSYFDTQLELANLLDRYAKREDKDIEKCLKEFNKLKNKIEKM